ncbi:MAG: shikimate kinase [Blastocatellia bacterium]
MESTLRTPRSVIFLVGFMACGKSTVGPVLGGMLDCPFIDLDRVIEARAGCTIAELIARDGEEVFRRAETAALYAAARERAVLAPGGGAIMRGENREYMLRAGAMVWLDAPFELCWRRIREDAVVRPLAPDPQTARGRYEDRLPLYRQAPLRVEITEFKTPEAIAEEILGLM